MTPDRFELVRVKAAPQRVVELRGEIDAANAPDLHRELDAMAADGPAILDLSPVAYFDSAGFAVLDRVLATGSVIVVISPSTILRRAATLMSVPFHDTVEQAGDALTEIGT